MRIGRAAIVMMVLGLAAGSASAQGMFVASRGRVYGGDADPASSVWSLAVGGMGARGIGSELEVSQAPRFFEASSPEGAGKVFTLMANITVVIPIARFRPYGVFGYGFIRERTETSEGGLFSDLTSRDVGYNLGGGVIFRLASHLGIRGDLRRFKVRRSDGIGFNRATVGIVLGG